MKFTPTRLFALVATVIFVLAAFDVAVGSVELIPLGLAFLAASFLV